MEQNSRKYRVLFSGGGTGGSVAPLLAVYDELKAPYPNLSPIPNVMGERKKNSSLSREERTGEGQGGGFEFLWLGTKYGPERMMVEKEGIKFKAISCGKWRRYFSLQNLVDILKIKIGFWQSFFIMLKWRPNLVMGAGSFVSVPVVWAAWILRVPVLVHQQDVRAGLANKLMAPFAKIITVTFEKSLGDYGKKAVWTGNPTRHSLEIPNPKSQIPNVGKNLPVVLVVGGGTGAEAINNLVMQSLEELTKVCQVIHVFGKQKGIRIGISNYFAFEFLDAECIAWALNRAEVIVTRAGLGFLSELSFLKKPAIIIPMPDSHQDENAIIFKDAAIVLEQKNLTAEKLTSEIKKLFENKELREKLGQKMGRVMKRGANQAMVKIVKEILNF